VGAMVEDERFKVKKFKDLFLPLGGIENKSMATEDK
jgi:hypothetical protein